MIISRLLGSFYLICFCVSDQRLLIDQLRWDFLELENEIWNMSSNGLLYMTREEAELYLCEKIHDFDRKLMQMPQDLLYGSEAMRGLPKFPSFHSELKMIETLYQKFKDYQQQVMAGRSDRVSLENITYDIKNNKSGAEKTVDGEYEISYENHNENFYQNFEDYYQQEVMTESPDRMSLEDIIYDIKNNKSGDEKTVDREYEISYEDHNENFYQNFEDYYQQEVMTESPDRMSLEDIIYDIQNNKSGADKTVDREYEISYEDHNETFHQNFEDYYQQEVMTESPDRMRLEDIIYDITNNKSGAEQTIDRAYEIAYKDSNGIQERLDKFDYSCINHLQSPQQPIYNLYNMFALTDLKAYILQQFSHLVNRLRNKGDFVDKSIAIRKNYESRVTKAMKSLSRTSHKQAREIWRCDPENFVEGKNYDQFTRLLQGHIQNEVDMSSSRTCTKTCKAYSLTTSEGCYEDDTKYCEKQERCHGTIRECYYEESRESICISDNRYRRYDFIRFKSGKTFGKGRSYCWNEVTAKSWLRGFVDCDYCVCLCDEAGHLSDRYIFVRPVLADIKNNSVVTGVRLIKKNRILHLQIQEGKLLPYGYINQSTVHWVNVDNRAWNYVGVFTMSYGERSMALDDIQVEKNHIVTGVRFEFIHDKIHFKIHVSPFDWHTGKVSHDKGYYIYNAGHRYRKNLDESDLPTDTYRPSEMHSYSSERYVEFTHSSFYKDAAQSTIPFIDIQEVVNKPAVPLRGAGIYYKGIGGYGGFIAPKIQTYDFAEHLFSKLPNMGDRHDVAEEPLIIKLK